MLPNNTQCAMGKANAIAQNTVAYHKAANLPHLQGRCCTVIGARFPFAPAL